MALDIPSHILRECIGVEVDTAEYQEVYEAVRKLLAEYPRRRAIFDSLPTVRLHRFENLQRAVQGLVDADAELDEGDRFDLAGCRQDGDYLVDAHPDLDVSGLAARLNAALNEALPSLGWATYKGARDGRRTETARDDTVRELALTFKTHYVLTTGDYRAHLADFLKELLHANRIPCPEDAQTILELLPQELKQAPDLEQR